MRVLWQFAITGASACATRCQLAGKLCASSKKNGFRSAAPQKNTDLAYVGSARTRPPNAGSRCESRAPSALAAGTYRSARPTSPPHPAPQLSAARCVRRTSRLGLLLPPATGRAEAERTSAYQGGPVLFAPSRLRLPSAAAIGIPALRLPPRGFRSDIDPPSRPRPPPAPRSATLASRSASFEAQSPRTD
jgi:hypothetical protein